MRIQEFSPSPVGHMYLHCNTITCSKVCRILSPLVFKKYLKHFILESWDLQICMTFIRTSFTCFSKLDGIAANTAKCINYQIALTSDCYVLGHLLGRGRKPTFCIINEAVKKLGVLPLQRHYDCLPWSITIPSSYREKSLYRWDQYFFK